MPTKLIKICNEYNITMQRVVEFLRIKGHEVALNLNSRITDEQYALIQQEFNAPPLLAIVWKSCRLWNCGNKFFALSIGPATSCGKNDTNRA